MLCCVLLTSCVFAGLVVVVVVMLCCESEKRSPVGSDGDKEGAPQQAQQAAAHRFGKADGSVCLAELEAQYHCAVTASGHGYLGT